MIDPFATGQQDNAFHILVRLGTKRPGKELINYYRIGFRFAESIT